MVLDGVVLRRQAEGVIAHGEQHVLALHAVLARDDVHGRIGAGMADVQTGTGRVREFGQRIEFLRVAAGPGGIELLFIPDLMPFGLDGGKIVLHVSFSPLNEL